MVDEGKVFLGCGRGKVEVDWLVEAIPKSRACREIEGMQRFEGGTHTEG